MLRFARYKEMMQQFGKYKSGVSCLYINSLNDIDNKVLKEVIKNSVDRMKKMGTLKEENL